MEDKQVEFLDPVTGATIDHCNGPSSEGRCPYADRQGKVPCNGLRIAAPDAGPELWHTFVPPGSRHCPQAWSLEEVGY
jgi:hypothetical protein